MIAAPALPPGFELIEEGRLQVAVRAEARRPLLGLLRRWAVGALPPSRSLTGGRGGVCAFDLQPDLTAVLRPCRRGGLLSRVNRDLYFGRQPRPLRELWVTETLRARGVPTVEILAAAVRWLAPGCYRGALVSREVRGAVNLWQALLAAAPAERAPICSAAAAATRQLHDAGAIHPDLNLQNYLVRTGRSGPEVLIIDCDRVRLGQVSAAARRAAFARLCRSVRRLDPAAAVVTLGCVEALRTVEAPASE